MSGAAGLCAAIFGGNALTSARADPTVLLLVLPGLALGLGGILLIRAAIRKPRPWAVHDRAAPA